MCKEISRYLRHATSSYQSINKYWVTERVCTRRARPQLARYSVNTKAVPGSVSPRSVSHKARSNINLALLLDCSRTVQTSTLRNLGTYIPNDTASYSRKQLRGPQISQETVLLPHSLHAALSPELQRTPYRHYSARLVNCTNHTLPRCHGTHPRHTATPIVPIFSRRARWPHGSLAMRSSTRLHDARS